MKVGYARVSTLDQDPALQRDALQAAGCEDVREERASGKNAERPVLQELRRNLREGDVLTVWKLDRLGRSLQDLIGIVKDLEARGVGFSSVTEGINTTSNGGRLVFHIFGALAEYERAIIRERTVAGLAAARARGRKGGRRPKLSPMKVELAKRLVKDPALTVRAVCETLGCSPSTLYRVTKNQPTSTTGSEDSG